MLLLQARVTGAFLKDREAILFNQGRVFVEAEVASMLMETREVREAKGPRDNMKDISPKAGYQDLNARHVNMKQTAKTS